MLQFPWRFYILVTIFLLLGFAILINEQSNDSKKRTHIMIILSIFAMFTFTVSTYYTSRYGLYNEVKKHHITWGEYVPLDVDIDAYKERGEIITSNNNIDISFDKNGTNIIVDYKNNFTKDTYIELPLLYYKGYVALDEKEQNLKVIKGENGMVRVYLEQEKGNIEVFYAFTTVRKVSIIISIISLLCFVLSMIKTSKENV